MLWRSFVCAGYCYHFQRIYRQRRIAQLQYEQRIAHLNEQTALSQLQIERLEAQISALKLSGMEREQEIALKQAELCRVIDEKHACVTVCLQRLLF